MSSGSILEICSAGFVDTLIIIIIIIFIYILSEVKPEG